MSLKPRWPGQDRDGRATDGEPPGVPGVSPIDPGGPYRARRVPQPVAAPPAPPSVAAAVRRATDALVTAAPQLDLRDPMVPTALRFARHHGADILPSPILGAWRTRTLSAVAQDRETPWTLGFDGAPNSPVYDTPDRTGALWRPRERDWLDRDPTGFSGRLLGPIALAENVDFLASLEADANPAVSRTAAEILREIQPRMEADLADCVVGADPWRDTFALWLVARRPLALARLHPLALAIATRYGTLANRLAGLVCGTRFPFEAVPLTSANAHLGVALWTLDYRPTLLAGITSFVRSRRSPDGGFSDEGQFPDVLTTLAAADLLSTLDPGFDTGPTIGWFARTQEPAGWWRALDPEVPWLTAAIVEWLEGAERPFAERFRWPAYQRVDLDRKTGIPAYVAFDRLARVFEALPGIAAAPVGIAFCDLAGFREFNNAHGQDMGDRALRTFATALSEIDASIAIRDGGDEFLVVGAPARRDLVEDLERFRAAWPARFAGEYGPNAGAVAPRILVTTTNGGSIRDTRERLGQAISSVKTTDPEPPPEGVLRRFAA
ncbi:MAG TPA: diguanylate cyclase [Candidatus Limnocylindrales bacterium]|nr:diguanylate cyclase [Candidatus Limnocylindrales bacterium]